MKANPKEFLNELEHWQIEFKEKYPRIILTGGNDQAREYYSLLLSSNPELEASVILELSKHDDLIMEAIEERAAIRKYDAHLSEDMKDVILGNIIN